MPSKSKNRAPRSFLRLRQVDVLLKTAGHASFAEASRAMGVEPASLSQAIAELEHDLGDVRLFERNQAGATLTGLGRLLVEKGERLLEAERAMREAVRSYQDRGIDLRIGYGTLFSGVVREAIQHVQMQHAGLNVRMYRLSIESTVKYLASGALDVAIHYLPVAQLAPSQRESVTLSILSRDRLCAIVGAKHPLRRLRFVDRSTLSDEAFAFLLDEDPELGGYLDQYAPQLAVRRTVFEGNDTLLLLDCLRSERAIAIGTTPFLCGDDQLRFLPLKNGPTVPIVMLKPKDKPPTLPAKLFSERLRHAIAVARQAHLSNIGHIDK